MGGILSGTPKWQSEQKDVICAYQFEKGKCFTPRRFVLRGVSNKDSHHPWNTPSSQAARKLVEGDIMDSKGVVATTAKHNEHHFDVAAKKLNQEWAPKMNSLLTEYGFQVDAFDWVEHRMSPGGGYPIKYPRFCVRVKKL